jgi:hypothetical protein
VFVHALSGAASFAACLRLFRSYPLAVSPCYSGGWHRSIVLRHHAFERSSACEGAGFYVLTQDPAEHFTLRPWNRADGECQEIRPGMPVPVSSHQVITEGMPVPRDGALLGWVSDRQATVLLSVYYGQPASQVSLPQVRVLAMVGSEPMRWPPFTASPLDDGRLWEYVERGEIVDLTPLIVRDAGGAFWVPSQNPGRAGQGHGCVVVNRSLQSEDYWVPAGTYMDHWMLREGVPSPPASHLLALPGATDLSRHLTAW